MKEKELTYIESFEKHPLFINSFVRKANLFAAETECW